MKNSKKYKSRKVGKYKEKTKNFKFFLLLFYFSTFPLFFTSFSFADTVVRVGVYEDAPVVFKDSSGRVSGIYVDILDKIAGKEKWDIEYIFGTWAECLQNLQSGQIDLLVDIAYSEERSIIYDFTKEFLISNWGQAYVGKKSGIQSILDIKDKIVAGVGSDIYYLEFKKLLKDFNIECKFIEAGDYIGVFKLLSEKQADVGIVNRLSGAQYDKDYSVDKTAIIFSPIELRVAAAKDKNKNFLEVIDSDIAQLKKDKDSFYYRTLDKWLGSMRLRQFPKWLLWFLASAAGLLVLFIFWNILLKTQVASCAVELRKTQDQLIQAAKMQVVGGLASGVAHEVKNPLAIILQGVEYLEKKIPADDKNISFALTNIKAAVERADNIVRSLMDFSRASKLDMEPANLNFVIERSLGLLKNHFDKYHILLTKDMKQDIPDVKIDKNKIEQVLINLLMNSVQAMPNGGNILIKTYKSGSQVAVEIEDSGAGIPKEAMAKIFDPFFTTKRNQGGTGLGLSVVKSIVEMHNGQIEIKNKTAGGVRVKLVFKGGGHGKEKNINS